MPEIARLKITLDRVEPTVMRRIEVPVDIRLDDLHLAIQMAMPWENYHLYEFRVGRTCHGEFTILISAASRRTTSRLTPPRRRSPISSTKAAARRSNTSTTSATTGSTASRWRRLPKAPPMSLIRG
jgi:hypothetical protein